MQSKRAAIYARYSTTNQRDTSLEDQIRRCRELAVRHGYEIADELIFTDAAVSGSDRKAAQRKGYKALVKAWEDGQFCAVLVDDHSRLSRGPVQQANLYELVQRTQVRFLSCNGLDSTHASWPLVFGIYGAVAQQALRDLQHLVTRGMLGQLERGFMIADAAFGYRRVAVQRADGTVEGTRWEVDEREASWVREIFEMRKAGKSYAAIARHLNQCGVTPPRSARDGSAGHWRQSTVHRLMQNRIYSGVFIWNGSHFARAKAKKEGRKLEPIAFERPELRIIDERTFQLCTANDERKIRANRRHLFAGLLRCGVCGSRLTIKWAGRSSKNSDSADGPAAKPKRGPMSSGAAVTSAYCGTCQQRASNGAGDRFVGYVSTNAVREALLEAHACIADKAVQARFREHIRKLIDAPHSERLSELEGELAKTLRKRERIARILADLPTDDELMEAEHRRLFDRQRSLAAELAKAKLASASDSKRQRLLQLLSVEISGALRRMLLSGEAKEASRAKLGRLFPAITLVERPARFVAIFDVAADVGAAHAMTENADSEERFLLDVRVEVRTTPRAPSQWQARVLSYGPKLAGKDHCSQLQDVASGRHCSPKDWGVPLTLPRA